MISECVDDAKLHVLNQLKKLNKKALIFMTAYQDAEHPGYPRRKRRYKALQRTEIWVEAKRLLFEYSYMGFEFKCDFCERKLSARFHLHHDIYVYHELFTPRLTQLLHAGCHRRIHQQGGSNK